VIDNKSSKQAVTVIPCKQCHEQ